jgi:acetoin utilization protein AcuC
VRVAYVDIDAHHGDGVFYAFESDGGILPDVQGRPHHPGTGAAHETGTGAPGAKLNIPMAPARRRSRTAWERVEEFLERARPQFILLQCGADSLGGDPITHLCFTPAAHRRAAERLCTIAERYCDGRLLATGGGGYNRRNVALGWTAVVRAFEETPAG